MYGWFNSCTENFNSRKKDRCCRKIDEKYSAKHSEICDDFEDYAEMPVVNSPRMGECGYSGGEIDTERDGPYKI